MITVGLFSSGLPYILLAMFYGAYMGISSIMSMEKAADAKADLPLANELEISDSQERDESRAFHYEDYFLAVAIENSEPLPTPPDGAGVEIAFCDPPYRSIPGGILRSRPPPVS